MPDNFRSVSTNSVEQITPFPRAERLTRIAVMTAAIVVVLLDLFVWRP